MAGYTTVERYSGKLVSRSYPLFREFADFHYFAAVDNTSSTVGAIPRRDDCALCIRASNDSLHTYVNLRAEEMFVRHWCRSLYRLEVRVENL